jgi:di/tricarboxylate transporter
MSLDIALTLGIILAALACFWWERYSADVVALGVLLALVFTGLLPAPKAFAGFASDTVIMILGLLIMTAALGRTGVVDLAAGAVLRRTGRDPDRLLWAIMVTSAGLSSFISNTAATAFFLPIVFGIARKAGVSASRFLMPLAVASILASSVTLISTSTNVVVSDMMTRYGMPPLSMFELAPIGLPVSIVGLLYMFYIGRRLVPERAPAKEMTEEFGVRDYLSEIVIQPKSALVDKTLEEAKFGEAMGLEVLRIIRDKKRHLPPLPQIKLKAGDMLLVEGNQEDIVKVKDTAGVEIKADVKLSDPDLQYEEMALAKAIVLPGSSLLGSTLKERRFRQQYGLTVLGLNHRGVNVVRKISTVPIQLGDVLLLQGTRTQLARLDTDPTFHVLGPMEPLAEARPRRRHAWPAIGIFAGVILLATFKVLPLAIAMMLGALLVFLAHCITPEEAYAAVEWKALILIGSMLGLGAAMEQTGTAAYLAQLIVMQTGELSPLLLLSGFFVLTVLLTQPMSNQAAAIIILPVAVQTAQQLNLEPRTFAVMIAVAASCSYLTPLEPACLMVLGPGHYRFADFLKVGALLTLLIFLIAIALVPVFWPLKS